MLERVERLTEALSERIRAPRRLVPLALGVVLDTGEDR